MKRPERSAEGAKSKDAMWLSIIAPPTSFLASLVTPLGVLIFRYFPYFLLTL